MARTKQADIAVSDAGPLIHLDELDSLDVLADFRVWVAEPVWQEVQQHRSSVRQSPALTYERCPVVGLASPALVSLSRALALDAGELAALVLMSSVPQSLFLTDDAAARLVAEQLGYRVHGTIGMLIRAFRRRHLSASEVLARLRSIPERSSLFVRPSLLSEIIGQVEQEQRIVS